MAHFAQLDDNNIVVNILVVDNAVIAEPDGTENEARGIAFLQEVCGDEFKYVQTSINANLRGQYAIIGGSYDSSTDQFIPPSLEPSVVRPGAEEGAVDSGVQRPFEWN